MVLFFRCVIVLLLFEDTFILYYFMIYLGADCGLIMLVFCGVISKHVESSVLHHQSKPHGLDVYNQ